METGAKRLFSRKLFVAVASIATIGLNQRLQLGITPEGVSAIVTIAVTALTGQAGIDLAQDLRPVLMDWVAGRFRLPTMAATPAPAKPEPAKPAPVQVAGGEPCGGPGVRPGTEG